MLAEANDVLGKKIVGTDVICVSISTTFEALKKSVLMPYDVKDERITSLKFTGLDPDTVGISMASVVRVSAVEKLSTYDGTEVVSSITVAKMVLALTRFMVPTNKLALGIIPDICSSRLLLEISFIVSIDVLSPDGTGIALMLESKG